MAKKHKCTEIVQVVNPICCGLDIHKSMISACLITMDEDNQIKVELDEFKTFTDDLIRLREWLLENECPIVAMESTGIYWRPVHNILEGYVKVMLVNARHFKNVPGRKTDLGDSQWLAGLLRNGMLKGSFIPSKEVREWRDITTHRKKTVETVSDYKKRVQKTLETSNIKIDSVATDLFGVSGRSLMQLLICKSSTADITFDEVENCLHGQLRPKANEIYRSINGNFTNHHRTLLISQLEIIACLEAQINKLNNHLKQLMSSLDELLSRLDEIPGINEKSAQAIISHIGPTLETFESSQSLCSWAGLCPGNNESAGKRHSGKTSVHNHPFKTVMVEVAWAAIKKKDSYYKDKYYRLKARRGAKRAIVAIAHRIAKAIYHIIKDGLRFKELGPNYLDQRNQTKKLANIKRYLDTIGSKVVPKEAVVICSMSLS